jgi:hypothetical protein
MAWCWPKGVARGVDAEGHLLLETAEGLQRIASGEVSLRGARHERAADRYRQHAPQMGLVR